MQATKGKYFLAETFEDGLHTASIVRKDNEKILLQQGFTALRFHHIKAGSVIVKLRRLNELIKLAMSVKKSDTFIFHFPLLANAYKILLRLLSIKGVNTIALIIDIDGLRYNNPALLKKELETLRLFTNVIAHNTSMKTFLSRYISEEKISCIELFDYPVTNKIQAISLSQPICFAGNFEKAAFANELYKIEKNKFNLYGPSYTAGEQKNVSYKGSFPSNELPRILEGSFGLVWDGVSINACDNYLQYNNPYKLSLYIAAGLPLIVWEKSAAAQFVQKHHIGILINSLYDIEVKVNNLPMEQYELMKQNIIPVREKIATGYFLKRVIEHLPGNPAV